MRFSSFARRRPEGRHYSGPAMSVSRPITLRVATGVLGLALVAGLGAGGVVSAPLSAQASTPEATAAATDPANTGVASAKAVDAPAESVDDASPTAGAMPAEDTAPAESAAPTESATSTESAAGVEDAEPAEGALPADATPTESEPAPTKDVKNPETAKAPLKIQALAAPKVRMTCDADVVYTIGDDKKIRRVNTGTGGQTDIGTINSPNTLNGLALTKDANYAFAVPAQPDSGNDMTVYRYSADGDTRSFKGVQNISSGGTFVMGGINPVTGIYYYGRVNATTLELYAFNPATESSIGKVGTIPVSKDSGSWVQNWLGGRNWVKTDRANGDLVFSSDGTMYFVASSNTTADDSNVLMRVNEPIPSRAGIAALTATEITPLNINNQQRQFNGIAFAGGYLYLDTSAGHLYKVDPSTGNLVGGGAITSGLSSPVDMASCQYNNSLKVQKNIVNRVAGSDQFTMTATVDNKPIGAPGTTTGTTTGMQTGPGTFASSVPISGTTIKIQETGASGTNLAQYTSTWVCTDGALWNVVGEGASGTFAFPDQSGDGVNVTCVFTNTPKTAKVTVAKTWIKAVAGDTAGFNANGETGTSTAPTNGNVITATFAQGTTVNVAEVLATNNKGVYTTTLRCTNAAGTSVATGVLTGSFVLGASDVNCAFINTNTAATVVVEKKWIVDGKRYDNGQQPAGIFAALTLTGPDGGGAPTPEWATLRSGYFAGNTVTIGETTSIDASMACKVIESQVTLANGSTTSGKVPFAAVLAPGANSYTVTNTVDCTTVLTLLKFIDDSNGGGLVPGDFTLTAKPTDGEPWDVAGANTVAETNTKSVTAGLNYALSESSADKAAYLQLSLQRYTGTLNSDGSLADPDAWADAGSASVSVATGHHEVYRFVNASAPAFALPLTGGTGQSAYMFVGGGLILLAALTGAWLIARRIKSKRT